MVTSAFPTRTVHCAQARFEAARQLQAVPAGHPSGRLHGHGFVAQLRGALPEGWARFPGGEVDRLQSELQAGVAVLDHRLLNEQLPNPTDGDLARWLRERVALPGGAEVGVQSTPQRGAQVDAQGGLQLWRRYDFQSAHWLPHVPAGHKCGRMHGHGFEVVLHVRADAARSAPLHHDDIDAAWAPLHQQLNLRCLNDLPGLANPTSELLASWLWERLAPRLAGLASVTVFETGSCGAVYDGVCHRIWKQMTLDAAVQLRRAPDGSGLRQLHGHTYTLSLHLTAPLDQVLGWAVDFGDVKSAFNPIFQLLDHQPLNEIADLADGDTASLAHWIFDRARGQLPQLDRVDLCETPGCGAIVLAGDATLAGPM